MVKLITQLGGTVSPLLRYTDTTDPNWSAFNPSIGWAAPLGYAMLIRSSNYLLGKKTGKVRLTQGMEVSTRTWFSEVSGDLSLENLREVTFDHGDLPMKRGVEDARLFCRNGQWHFTAVMLERAHTRPARLAEYRLDTDSMVATYLGKLETETPTRPEKNWMAPDVASDKFDYIYSTQQYYKSGALYATPNAPKVPGIRGGSGLMLQEDGTYLAIVHRVDINESRVFNTKRFATEVHTDRDYRHLFALYDNNGTLIATSPEFRFEERGVEYAAGLAEKDGNLVISYGKHDISSHLAVIPKNVALSLLEPVVDSA